MLDYLVIDAFTDVLFRGNPAAVVRLDVEALLGDAQLQRIAAEFNLSETAFVQPVDAHGADAWSLRWFTPRVEVPLCGHATLAAAHALRAWGLADADAVLRFITRRRGCLTARFAGDRVVLDFPQQPGELVSMPPNAAAVLGVREPIIEAFRSDVMLTLRLPDAEAVRQCQPRFGELVDWHPQAVAVTAEGDEPGIDFVSRFFAPAVGIDEDPVTGSAHCTLGPYWSQKLGRNTLTAQQLSRRGGRLHLRTGDNHSIELAGEAVTVMRGVLMLGG